LPRGAVAAFAASSELRPATTTFASTSGATAEDRVALFERAAASVPDGAAIGGSVTHVTATHSVANTDGVRRAETRTRAAMQVVATVGDRSSWARVVARDAAEVDVPDVGAGLAELPSRELAPGRYRAVLAPQAVVTLLATLGQVAFAAGAGGSLEDRVGAELFSLLLSVVDDGCDDAGLPSTFDCEGVAKARVPLVERGVVRGVVSHATGHAVPPGWRFGAGPAASHLLLAAGDATDEALLEACGDGLYLQRVDYVRVVQPRQTVVTGSSRDATLWIAGGRPVARLPQFRFTLRLDELFASVAALGARRERGETPFMESIVTPGMVVDAFPVDLVTG
jgi:predicted Zn-dependent protease